MRRVLLLYKDLNTRKLIQNRFELAGFWVISNYEQALQADDFDLLIKEDDNEISLGNGFLGLPTIQITNKVLVNLDSEQIVYVKKPFRPSELVIKAKILLTDKQGIDFAAVKKSA